MDIQAIYEQHDALLKGHFLLSSGKHSSYYLQSAKVLEYPPVAQALAQALAQKIKTQKIKTANIAVDTVCSPALGGILAGYELAKALGVRFIFTERVDGQMALRRGFSIKEADRIIICEDIITTGGSALESAKVVEGLGGKVVGFCALVNRGFCSLDMDTSHDKLCKLPPDRPVIALDNFTFPTYEASHCPLCKQGSIAYKPGSRPSSINQHCK